MSVANLIKNYAPRLENMTVPALILDTTGRVLYMNTAFAPFQDHSESGIPYGNLVAELISGPKTPVWEKYIRVPLPDNAGIRRMEWKCVEIPIKGGPLFLAWGDNEDYTAAMGFTIQADGRIQALSPTLCELCGFTPQELLGKAAQLFYFTNASRRRIVSRLQESNFVEKGEVTLRCKDGSPLSLCYSAESVRNADGSLAAFSGFFQHCARALSARLIGEFARMVDVLPNPAWVIDREYRLVAANDAYLRAYNLTREKALGRTEYDFLPQETARFPVEAAIRVFEEKQEFLLPAVPHPLNPQIWQKILRRPIFDDERQEVIGLLGVEQDVTEKVLRENAYMESLRSSSACAVISLDTQGHILRRTAQVFSPSLFGRPGIYDAYRVEPLSFFDQIHPEDLRELRQTLQMALGDPQARHVECRVRNQTGHYSSVQICLARNDDFYGEPRIYAVLRDVTDTKNRRAAALIVERLRMAAGARTDRELAAFLNVSPAAVSNARKNERVPADWLIETGLRTSRSIDWLVSGTSS